MQALVRAGQKGVQIDLIVRGACMLPARVPGVTDNIRVRSIIGRFLEHSRIFYFRNDLAHDTYLASADWMTRNLFRRIEVAFPVLDKALKRRVIAEGLNPYLKDNSNAWELDANGQYHRHKARGKQTEFSAQRYLMELLGSAEGGNGI
jgi:polyphosphate kinase